MNPAHAVPRKHRWFQIHLSTAVVLMFVAGGLLYGNMTAHVEQPVTAKMNTLDVTVSRVTYGFPTVFWSFETYTTEIDKRGQESAGDREVMHPERLILNIAILPFFAFLCEYLIRRREERKP